MSIESITKILLNHSEVLSKEYSVESLYLFGSHAVGDAKKKSDIDLLVEFNQEVGLFKFAQLKRFLTKILKSNVDLVTPDAVVGWMKESIDKEKIRVA